MELREKLFKLPKVELHCHLSGSIRSNTIMDIANKEGIWIPTKDANEFEKYVKVIDNCKSLKEYLKKFDFTLSVMQKPHYLYRITYELLEDMWMQNVKYIEIRVAPFFHVNHEMSFEVVVETILKAMDKAKEDFGIVSNLILICMRHHDPKVSIEVVEKGKQYLNHGVVGVDLAGNESDFPPELHKEAFNLAKEYGFHITVHAGETGIPQNIITAIEDLHAERIGHGVHSFLDDKVLSKVISKNITLEQCISSNVQTGAVESFEKHPIKTYLDFGVIVTVNTDNTTVSNTSLLQEYMILMEYQGFTIENIGMAIKNGLERSFASSKQIEKLRSEFKSDFNKLGLIY